MDIFLSHYIKIHVILSHNYLELYYMKVFLYLCAHARKGTYAVSAA